MYHSYLISEANKLEELQDLAGCSPLSPSLFRQHQPNLHLAIIQDDKLLARCSLWWKNTPEYGQEKLGLIGHYACQTIESSSILLTQAIQVLAQHHCTLAVAPIDGNTWRNYRWMTHRGEHPLFFLEPDYTPEYVDRVVQFGFTPLAQYYSALVTDLSQTDKRLSRVGDRLQKLGITIRTLNLEHWTEELRKIHQVAQVSFSKNFLYTPLSESEFVAQYTAIRPYVNPEFIFLAEQGEKIIGFLFAIPNYRQLKQQKECDSIILKTVGVLGDRAYAGLGNFLISKCHHTADRLGYKSVIHALMYQGNSSLNISARYGKSIRQYSLFAKAI